MTPLISRHKKRACDSRSRRRRLSIAAAFLWIILFAVPTAADAQSWMKSLEQAGKQILDRTVDQVSPPSKSQQGQQTAPAPQPPSGANPSYTRAQLREVQRMLLDLGYKPGAVDGTYLPATAAAIRAYQSDHGLPPTGVPSSELVAHLRKTQDAKLATGAGQTPTRPAPTPQTSQPGGGMIAPAPEGAPVTAAQRQSSETNIKSKSSTQSPSSPSYPAPTSAEIDPIAPGGATLGATLSEVGAALTAAGYRGAPCAGDRRGYFKQVGAGQISVALYSGKGCPASAPVAGVTYRQTRIPVAGSPAEIVDRAARRLGADPKCSILNQRVAVCDWPSPPTAPLVKNVRLWYEGPSDATLRIYLDGVNDLALNKGGTESRPAETGPTESKVKSSTQSPGFADSAAQSSQALQTANTMPSPGGSGPTVASATPGGALSDTTIPLSLLLYNPTSRIQR